ncbi:MAG: universal stress protein [Campylobacterota bacterium]|nr:universal stress protein [Campylobacterota bacterium]
MEVLKRIVAAVDNSKIADEVLKRALLLAEEDDCVVTVVHTIDVPWFDAPKFFGGDEFKEIDEIQIKKKIEEKVEKLTKGTNVKYSVFVSSGDASGKIIHIAQQEDAQIIILGAHGKDDITTKKFGTTAQKVTQDSHIPVLVVKNRAEVDYKNILVPTDLSEFSQKSIQFTKNVFKNNDIKLVHIYQQPVKIDEEFYNLSYEEKELLNKRILFFAKQDLEKFEKSVDIQKGELIESSTTVEDDLTNVIKNNNNDLVIMGSHGTKNIHSFLFGSTASFLMKESPSDILVYVP